MEYQKVALFEIMGLDFDREQEKIYYIPDLLYSDESMEWMTGDKVFLEKGQALFREIISKGHKIKVIHTIKRDICELLLSIEHWVPLYMTGN